MQVPPAAGFEPMVITKDQIWGIRLDQWRVEHLLRFRLDRTPGSAPLAPE